MLLRWADLTRPRVIMLENVEEFKTWGRLAEDGKPCPKHKGETFRSFVKALRYQGYDVEWRELKACDYGSPTTRKRFFLLHAVMACLLSGLNKHTATLNLKRF